MGLDATKKWDAELTGYAPDTSREYDENALSACLNELKALFPELVDIHLPEEAGSDGMVMVSVNKCSVGQGPRVIKP